MTPAAEYFDSEPEGGSGTHFYLFDIRFESSAVGDR
jgi:hypothetical protein